MPNPVTLNFLAEGDELFQSFYTENSNCSGLQIRQLKFTSNSENKFKNGL